MAIPNGVSEARLEMFCSAGLLGWRCCTPREQHDLPPAPARHHADLVQERRGLVVGVLQEIELTTAAEKVERCDARPAS